MFKPIDCLNVIALVVALQMTGSAADDAEWDRTVLPRPPQPFQGVTKRSLEGSIAAFTQPVKAPSNAPNILLVLIDDAGFGNPRSEEHTSELQSQSNLVCRLLLEKKKRKTIEPLVIFNHSLKYWLKPRDDTNCDANGSSHAYCHQG